jgi:hypothetical protein
MQMQKKWIFLAALFGMSFALWAQQGLDVPNAQKSGSTITREVIIEPAHSDRVFIQTEPQEYFDDIRDNPRGYYAQPRVRVPGGGVNAPSHSGYDPLKGLSNAHPKTSLPFSERRAAPNYLEQTPVYAKAPAAEQPPVEASTTSEEIVRIVPTSSIGTVGKSGRSNKFLIVTEDVEEFPNDPNNTFKKVHVVEEFKTPIGVQPAPNFNGVKKSN